MHTLTIEESSECKFTVVARSADGTKIGYLEGDYLAERFWIGNCAVERPWRRKGVGREMVEFAIDEAWRRYANRETYIEAAKADNVPRSEVIAFWSTLGFVPYAESVPGRAYQGPRMVRTRA